MVEKLCYKKPVLIEWAFVSDNTLENASFPLKNIKKDKLSYLPNKMCQETVLTCTTALAKACYHSRVEDRARLKLL